MADSSTRWLRTRKECISCILEQKNGIWVCKRCGCGMVQLGSGDMLTREQVKKIINQEEIKHET